MLFDTAKGIDFWVLLTKYVLIDSYLLQYLVVILYLALYKARDASRVLNNGKSIKNIKKELNILLIN